MKGIEAIAPAYFRVSDGKSIVEVTQSHRQEFEKSSPKDYWTRLVVLTEGERIILSITSKEGAKEATSRLTLSKEDIPKLVHHFDLAVKDVDEFVAYAANEQKEKDK